jgi:hypothetical protein
MNDDRWTPETEYLVAMELEDMLPREVGDAPDLAFFEDARRILGVLADRGLLIVPMIEPVVRRVWREWGVSHATLGIDGPVITANTEESDEDLARKLIAASGNLKLVHRRVHEQIGPWLNDDGTHA